MLTNTKPICIDLQAAYGDRYKTDVDVSFDAEKSEFRVWERNWLTQILCLNGHIGVWGDAQLVACTSKSGPVAKELKHLPFVEIVADGSDGTNVTFDVDHFNEVAMIMKPRMRRRARPMTNEEKQRLIEAGREFRFSTGRQRSPEAHSRVETCSPV